MSIADDGARTTAEDTRAAPDDGAFDEATRLDPDLLEAVDRDESAEYVHPADELEQREADIVFDDPEEITMLDGGMDDPDGAGGPSPTASITSPDDEGWDLDAPEV